MLYWPFYTDWFIPSRFGGVIYGPIILIRPKYRTDIGLFEHEKTHVRQWYRGWGIGYWLAYHFSKKRRLQYEVEGYRVQLKYNPDRVQTFALYLSTKYNLGISVEDAMELLA